MSSIFVFFFVIIAIYVAIGLFTRARRGLRQGGRTGVRPPGYDQWQQRPGAYGYDSNGNPIEPGFGQPGYDQPGQGGHHGSGGHHGGFGGGHGGHGGGGFGGHGGGHGGGDAGGGGGGGHH